MVDGICKQKAIERPSSSVFVCYFFVYLLCLTLLESLFHQASILADKNGKSGNSQALGVPLPPGHFLEEYLFEELALPVISVSQIFRDAVPDPKWQNAFIEMPHLRTCNSSHGTRQGFLRSKLPEVVLGHVKRPQETTV